VTYRSSEATAMKSSSSSESMTVTGVMAFLRGLRLDMKRKKGREERNPVSKNW
jgi:hypothetical protein